MTRITRLLRAVICFVASLCLCTACASGSNTAAPLPLPVDDSGAYVFDELAARADMVSRARFYADITELLDNVLFQVGDQDPQTITQAVVLGRITAVTPGKAFSAEDQSADHEVEVPYNDPDASWRSMHVVVAVEEAISGSVGGLTSITVGFAFGARTTVDRALPSFLSMGRVLLFLTAGDVFSYDPELFGVVEDGALLGLVDPSGVISMPVLGDQSGAFTATAPTIDLLRTAASDGVTVVRIGPDGTRLG